MTRSATEPLISVLFDHWSTESSVLEATYFGVRLIQLANGSSVDLRALGRPEEAWAHWLEALAIFERLGTADAVRVRALLADQPANQPG